jgi:hypothetical protein
MNKGWALVDPCTTTTCDLSDTFLTGELLLVSQKGLCCLELDLVGLQLQVCDGSISRPCSATKRLKTRTVIFNCEWKSLVQFNVIFLLTFCSPRTRIYMNKQPSAESITTLQAGVLLEARSCHCRRDTNWIAERSFALCDICGLSTRSATVS